ncbi:hypothetical protein [Oscillatoria sp. HE19RPO]|uniref:hypothetical protein n=1 Tax=Oscillatoria sp. HE19RPO TaxID=2954806 RepID=UPI0020C33CFD|nr:hypothetical protein [Oscillatoria sp. HE19RPO]
MPPNDPSSSLPELKQQHERQRLLTQVALRIRESLNVDQILNATVVEEVRELPDNFHQRKHQRDRRIQGWGISV